MAIRPIVLLTTAAAVVLAGAILVMSQTKSAAQAPTAPPVVDVTVATARPFAPFAEYTGRLEAVDHVELRARVSGYVQNVSVPEGAIVRRGTSLFRIDPAPFQAALDAARARRQEAEARLALARSEYDRSQALHQADIVAERQLDKARAELQAGEAQVRSARSQEQAAALDLSYTNVIAPISGRIGQVLVTQGNLVSASGGQALTTIVSVDPLYVSFDVDEATYLQLVAGDRGAQGATVRVGLANQEGFPHEARLHFVGNQVDAGTGTIRVRAKLANPNGELAPGLFARVRLETGPSTATVFVPDQAIGVEQGRRFVLVLNRENKVVYRPVRVGRAVGGLRAIETGVSAGERVIVKGMVAPGTTAKPNLLPPELASAAAES